MLLVSTNTTLEDSGVATVGRNGDATLLDAGGFSKEKPHLLNMTIEGSSVASVCRKGAVTLLEAGGFF
jgi:hypothetical protein